MRGGSRQLPGQLHDLASVLREGEGALSRYGEGNCDDLGTRAWLLDQERLVEVADVCDIRGLGMGPSLLGEEQRIRERVFGRLGEHLDRKQHKLESGLSEGAWAVVGVCLALLVFIILWAGPLGSNPAFGLGMVIGLTTALLGIRGKTRLEADINTLSQEVAQWRPGPSRIRQRRRTPARPDGHLPPPPLAAGAP